MNIPLFIIALLVLISCSDHKSGDGEYQEEKIETISLEFESGKKAEIRIIKKSASLNDLIVQTMGFDHDLNDTLPDHDPLSDAFLADLDQNGFQEIYLITVSAGSGSYGKVIAYGSNRDISISPIYVYPAGEEDRRIGDLFLGYRGHDQFVLEDSGLIRSFPVYADEDPNARPSQGQRKIRYELVKGEASWQLRIKDHESID